ncbi:MAG: hypothetical protein IMF13_00570 [Proteobacteria bacterium]|nr:hypothetical protein [Pseudomonadota bacterium]
MLNFIKNLYRSFIALCDAWLQTHYLKVLIAIVCMMILILLFGCGGSQVTNQGAAETETSCDYVTRSESPSWISKDILNPDDGQCWGMQDAFTFRGANGLCHALLLDLPPADGSCDLIAVVCETENTDDRHGPNTPLVAPVKKLECSRWNELKTFIQKENLMVLPISQ